MACGPPYYLPLPSGCGGSGSGSGSGGGSDPCCATQLAAFPDVDVNIPDGRNAGSYTAAWDGVQWTVVIAGGDKFRMACIKGVMKVWLDSDPSTTVSATASACSPVMFSFPGAIFGSTGDITVGL